MRAGLSTIQQTLTPEASAVLNQAIAEASRRRHGQTTPLHVAAALLSSPSGHLRHACIRSHPNPSSSHPLQCRALELCFSVALDRLPSSSNATATATASADDSPPPPISNALMAALKRAQAHQRRGCPESQQQPLLAVKVELEHLLLSILDDPSVSRVMREASFSSPAVKASIENSLSSSSPSPSPSPSPARNLYLSSRLIAAAAPAAAAAAGGGSDIAKVFDILTRTKKRNPILVGDADPGAVMREVIGKIGAGDAPAGFRSVGVMSIEKELAFSSLDRTDIPSKIKELHPMIELRSAGGGIILDLGDLKWLVEGASQQQSLKDFGRSAVTEIGRLLVRFGGRLSLVGTATCATYLRCQVYFPTMESDWDLQAVPIAPRSTPLSGCLVPRVGNNGILNSKIESFGTPRGFPPMSVPGMTVRKPSSESLDALCKISLCNLCKESYERDVAKLGDDESEKSAEGTPNARKSLPRWLQMATTTTTTTTPSPALQNLEQELMKKWRDNCFRLHRNSLPVTPKPQISAFQLTKPVSINQNQLKFTLQERPPSPAATVVKTDLALGPVQKPAAPKFTGDATSIKRLINGLLDKVSWQAEAASAVAAAVIQANSGIGKRRNGSQKTDTWLLFAGPDRVAKHNMAVALSDLVFGATPLIIRLGSPETAAGEPEEYNVSFRGRTSIDRVAEALRVNPFSTIFFEDFDQTDSALRGTIKRAMERGRLVDSRGREVCLGNAIFILTARWLPEELGNSNEELRRSEEKITKLATSGRQLELQLEAKNNKRRSQWFNDERLTKPRKDSLSLDLNLAAGSGAGNEEAGEGSWNSSDLTVEHGQEQGHGRLVTQSLATPILKSSWTSELIELIDATILFKPMDFTPLRTKVSDSVSSKFTQIMGEGWSIAIDDDALDQMTGGVWLGGDACNLFDEWTERVLAPAVEQLRGSTKFDDGVIVRLSSVKGGGQSHRSYLPSFVKVAVGDR